MPTHNLPLQSTPFIGRKDELAEIANLLATPECRLLTLTGPGGIGKTRLALEATKRLQDQFTNGVYFVNFQPVDSTDFLASTIADAINMPLSAQEDLRTLLLNFLHNKEMLLVLDNFEHLLAGAGLLTDVLHAAPGVKLLITSREVLSLQEEWLYPVQGMPYPQTEDAERLETYSAVQLFVERARRVRRNFSLSDERAGVVRMCRMLEGMPLAIEIAAAWTKTLPCVQIASEIQRNFDFLATSLRNVPERHQSMQAVFRQSWNMLTNEECSVFRKLSVFRGGFRREAAEQVAGASLTILAWLVDKSLLVSGTNGRYQIHELLRQYGEAQLEARPEEALHVHDLHCAYYTDYLDKMDDDLHSIRPLEARAEVMAEIENIRSAWQWAVDHTQVEALQKAVHPIHAIYQFQGRYLEWADAFQKAAQRLESSGQQGVGLALVLMGVGWLFLRLGQIEKSRNAFEKSHAIYQTLNVPPPALQSTEPLIGLSIVAIVAGDYAQAVQLAEQACQGCEARGDRNNLPYAYYALASAWLAQGNYQAAKQAAQKGCVIAQSLNAIWIMAYCLINLGDATRALGNFAEARQHYQASFAIREKFDDAGGMAVALYHLGKVASLQGDYQEAKRLYQHSLTLYRDIGDRGGLATALLGLGMAACSLGEDRAARQHFHAALQMALAAQLVPLALSILVSISELLILTGQQERGVELTALVLHHSASDHETKDRAQRLLTRYQTTPDSLAETVERRPGGDFNTITAALLNELLVADDSVVASHPSPREWTLVEPLTERELEILRLVADGLSNQEIAEQLVLAVSTVKWHLNEIYSKLHVASRTQAIRRAQELHLLS